MNTERQQAAAAADFAKGWAGRGYEKGDNASPSAAGLTSSPTDAGLTSSLSDAGLTNSPSKIRGGRGALTTAEVPLTTEHVMNTGDMKSLRRNLRTNGTPAEGALWRHLRAKQVGGLQFRRQFSVGPHILDFYCPALRLSIELDGNYHYYGAMPEHDLARDEELLQKYGIRTLRFENKLVFQQPEAIVNSILQVQAEVAEGVQDPRGTNGPRGVNGRRGVNAPQPPLILEGELVRPASDGELVRLASDGEPVRPASEGGIGKPCC